MHVNVSIPFKREGTCKLMQEPLFDNLLEDVSIPFKREGTCKRKRVKETTKMTKSFNSLQTGRHV